MLFLGIDPSQRHTGLCFLENREAEPHFCEIQTGDLPLAESALDLRSDFRTWVGHMMQRGDTLLVAMEKQVVGGHMSLTLFHIQMVLIEELATFSDRRVKLVFPLPVQLKKYMRERHGVIVSSKTQIVRSYQEKYGGGRISSHKVEAFYLALMGIDCSEGSWKYKLPAREPPLSRLEIVGGVRD